MTSATRVLTGALAALLLAASPAAAASPETGTIDQYDNQRVDWSGEAMGSVLQYGHFFNGGQIVDDCEAPLCDRFELTIADDKQRVEISAEDSTGYTEMQVKDPDGNEIFWDGGDDGMPTTFVATYLKAGTYTVEVLTDALAPGIDDASYVAYAEMNRGVPNERPAEPGDDE